MALFKCPGCGHDISTTAASCPHCGLKFTVCPECGGIVKEGAKSCPQCGYVFGGSEAKSEKPAQPEKPTEKNVEQANDGAQL